MTESYDFGALPPGVQAELLRARAAAAGGAAAASGWLPSTPRLTFAHGLLVGQLTVILMVVFFLKFFIFAEAPRDKHSAHAAVNGSLTGGRGFLDRRLRKKKSRILRGPSPLTATQILNKTYYNTSSHRAESLDWFNVLIAQALSQFRDDAQSKDAILHSLDAVFNGDRKPDFLGPIKITEVNMGDEFPIFSHCRIDLVNEDGTSSATVGATNLGDAAAGNPFGAASSAASVPGSGTSPKKASGSGGGVSANGSGATTGAVPDKRLLHATMDIDFSDQITLAVETSLLLNFPTPAFASLPVALGVTICRFSATLSVSFIPPADRNASTSMTFALQPNFELDLSIRSLIGSRSRLQDIPKVAQLVESALRGWLEERCVMPKYQRIDIPSMWPSKTRTREPSSGVPPGSADSSGGGGGGGGDVPATATTAPVAAVQGAASNVASAGVAGPSVANLGLGSSALTAGLQAGLSSSVGSGIGGTVAGGSSSASSSGGVGVGGSAGGLAAAGGLKLPTPRGSAANSPRLHAVKEVIPEDIEGELAHNNLASSGNGSTHANGSIGPSARLDIGEQVLERLSREVSGLHPGTASNGVSNGPSSGVNLTSGGGAVQYGGFARTPSRTPSRNATAPRAAAGRVETPSRSATPLLQYSDGARLGTPTKTGAINIITGHSPASSGGAGTPAAAAAREGAAQNGGAPAGLRYRRPPTELL